MFPILLFLRFRLFLHFRGLSLYLRTLLLVRKFLIMRLHLNVRFLFIFGLFLELVLLHILLACFCLFLWIGELAVLLRLFLAECDFAVMRDHRDSSVDLGSGRGTCFAFFLLSLFAVFNLRRLLALRGCVHSLILFFHEDNYIIENP